MTVVLCACGLKLGLTAVRKIDYFLGSSGLFDAVQSLFFFAGEHTDSIIDKPVSLTECILQLVQPVAQQQLVVHGSGEPLQCTVVPDIGLDNLPIILPSLLGVGLDEDPLVAVSLDAITLLAHSEPHNERACLR